MRIAHLKGIIEDATNIIANSLIQDFNLQSHQISLLEELSHSGLFLQISKAYLTTTIQN